MAGGTEHLLESCAFVWLVGGGISGSKAAIAPNSKPTPFSQLADAQSPLSTEEPPAQASQSENVAYVWWEGGAKHVLKSYEFVGWAWWRNSGVEGDDSTKLETCNLAQVTNARLPPSTK